MNRSRSFIRHTLLAATANLARSVTGCVAAAIGIGVVCCAAPALAAVATSNDTQRDCGGDCETLTATIEIPDVDCAACNLDVRKAIKGAGGVRRLNEGTPKNRVIVTYEPGSGRPDVYVEALHKAGFAKAHAVG